MKKLISVAAIAAMSLSLINCGGGSKSNKKVVDQLSLAEAFADRLSAEEYGRAYVAKSTTLQENTCPECAVIALDDGYEVRYFVVDLIDYYRGDSASQYLDDSLFLGPPVDPYYGGTIGGAEEVISIGFGEYEGYDTYVVYDEVEQAIAHQAGLTNAAARSKATRAYFATMAGNLFEVAPSMRAVENKPHVGEILAMVDTVNRVRSAGGEISQADAKELIEVAFKSDADLVVSTINGYIADMEKGGEVSSGTQTGIEAIAGNLGVSANDASDQITDLVNSNQ